MTATLIAVYRECDVNASSIADGAEAGQNVVAFRSAMRKDVEALTLSNQVIGVTGCNPRR